MNPLKVRCPDCQRDKMFLPMKGNKEVWGTQCFFCGKKFKIYPKKAPSRVVG